MKRVISMLLCVLYFGAMITSVVAAEDGTDIWDGTVDTSWFNYKDFAFYLNSAEAFAGFASLVNSNEDFAGVTVYLTTDIDINQKSWTEIGTYSGNAFNGTFDGGNHHIYNLKIYKSDSSNGDVSTGLFGYNSGTIKNIVLASGSHTGANNCGGIVAYNFGAIQNCVNYVDVQGGNLTWHIGGGYYDGSVSVGGIAGCNQGTIIDCTNYGSISYDEGESIHVGGIAGYNIAGYSSIGSIIGCTNYGTSSRGGILGENEGTVDRCINNAVAKDGVVNHNSTDATIKNCINNGAVSSAGIVGTNSSGNYLYNCVNNGIAEYGICSSNHGTIANCYNCGEITIGSIAPINNITGDITNCYAYEEYITRVDVTAAYLTFNSAGILNDEYHSLLVDTLNSWVNNNGDDYLGWYVKDQFPTLAFLKGIVLSESITLCVGDSEVLTVETIPGTEVADSFIWVSSSPNVATVTASGKVTAIEPGTATITVTTADGNYTATCSVTVKERKSDEYKINSINVRDDNGKMLTSIPAEDFLASLSITNLASEGDTLVFLAAYTSEGQYKGLMWVSVKDIPVGTTIEVVLPVDNSDGIIAQLKAFSVSTLGEPIPLGVANCFPK